MRGQSLIAATLAALALRALTGATSAGAAAPDCQELLDSNVYRCSVKCECGSDFEDCFRFTSPGAQSSDFDLNVDGIDDTLSCDCRAKGAFKSVKFSESTEFQCVSPALKDAGIAFTGKVANKGEKLKKVQAVNETGNTFFIECVLDPACGVESVAGGVQDLYEQACR
jgi:hypothetical protein